MSLAPASGGLELGTPEPLFRVERAAHRRFAASPTMVFSALAENATAHAIHSIALTVAVMIDPARRGYDAATRARLAELFGPPASWTPSTQALAWARVGAFVPAFEASTAFEIEVPCTYDLEVASAKYFHALADPPLDGAGGEVALSFHFSGTVFYHGRQGRLEVAPVPWSRTAQFGMPLAAWQAMIAEHYPGGSWIRLGHDTLAALNARRAVRGLASFDACITELLDSGAEHGAR